MNNLYLLTEDDNDDLFYERCLEELTGNSFNLISYRTRKNSGISDVRKMSRRLLQILKYTGDTANAYFLLVMDNDRRPAHPDHNKLPGISKGEQNKQCRFCELQKIVHEILGEDRVTWPAKGAIAVPVQMLESWLLLICKSNLVEDDLPIFSGKEKSGAKQYHQGQKIPDQLKDLCGQEQLHLNLDTKGDFYFYCADQIDIEDLATRSASFALFKEQVDNW